ncbi:MAG: electron transfer flavoprotein subunit beta/FixA family protein [Desulfatibacillaceae bacterium]
MKILVLVKQIPDPDHALGLNGDTGLVDSLAGEYRMDRYSAQAVEEALTLRDALGEARIHALCAGPAEWEPAVRRAVAMGADSGTLLSTGEAPARGMAAALAIAEHVRDMGFDLILAGVASEDIMAGITGPFVAGALDLPLAVGVVGMSVEDGVVVVERECEGGVLERLRLDLPAVVCVQTGSRRPRYPTLSHMLRANRTELETVEANLPPVPGRTLGYGEPAAARAGTVLEGSAEDKAGELYRILKGRGLL